MTARCGSSIRCTLSSPSPLTGVKAEAASHPEWKDTQPFKAVLEGDMKALAAAGDKGLLELIMATHAGMTNEEFQTIVTDWISTARDPKFKKSYTELRLSTDARTARLSARKSFASAMPMANKPGLAEPFKPTSMVFFRRHMSMLLMYICQTMSSDTRGTACQIQRRVPPSHHML
jgi:hypothetical protein